MMRTDIGGEPAQHPRKDVVRVAVQRGFLELPVRVRVPAGLFELVLDIEESDADRRGDNCSREEDEK